MTTKNPVYWRTNDGRKVVIVKVYEENNSRCDIYVICLGIIRVFIDKNTLTPWHEPETLTEKENLMSKYKAGDKVTVVLDEQDAQNLNKDNYAYWYKKQIIAHESAPEPIVMYANVYDGGNICGGHSTIEVAKNYADIGHLGIIKVTITANDFTVERVV